MVITLENKLIEKSNKIDSVNKNRDLVDDNCK